MALYRTGWVVPRGDQDMNRNLGFDFLEDPFGTGLTGEPVIDALRADADLEFRRPGIAQGHQLDSAKRWILADCANGIGATMPVFIEVDHNEVGSPVTRQIVDSSAATRKGNDRVA